ncbi:MAG TPA: hypothetical protein VFN75_07865 [Pseudonocardiaceae bacterium]|nr:hypothetical protein [Pseudonocardiaceae bacterium]
MTETLAQAPFTVTAGPLRHARYAELAASGPAHTASCRPAASSPD